MEGFNLDFNITEFHKSKLNNSTSVKEDCNNVNSNYFKRKRTKIEPEMRMQASASAIWPKMCPVSLFMACTDWTACLQSCRPSSFKKKKNFTEILRTKLSFKYNRFKSVNEQIGCDRK